MTTEGGLKLPDNLGLGELIKNSIYKKWNTMDDIEAQLKAKGFILKERPDFDCPLVTEANLTKHGEDFTSLYARVLAWFNYVSPMVAACRALSVQWENKKTIIEATLRKDMRRAYRDREEKVPSKEELEDEVHTNADFQECLLEQQKASQLKIMFDAYSETVYQSMKVVSRQVEINKQEFDSGRANTNGRPFHQPVGRGGR